MEQQPLPTAEPSADEVLVRDPLAPVTRKERLYLLAVSMIGIAMVKTGLVPTKIATFGIELDKPNRSALLFLLALITIYFFVAFLIYAASDYVARREAFRAVIQRDYTKTFYWLLASELSTSQENVRALHARGELRAYAATQYGKEEQSEGAPSIIESLIRSLVEAEGTTGFVEDSYLEDHRPNVVIRVGFFFIRLYKRVTGLFYRVYKQPDVHGTAAMRMFFEFLLPLLVGGYAIYSLLDTSTR